MEGTLEIAGPRSAQWHCPRCTVAHSLTTSNCGVCGFQRRARRSGRRPSHSSPHGLLGVLAKAAFGGALGFAAGQTGLLCDRSYTSSITLMAAVAVFPAIRVIKGVLGLFRGFGGGRGSGGRPARSAGGLYYHRQRQHGSSGAAGAEGAAGGVASGLWGAAGGGGEGRSDRVQLVMSMVRWLRVLEGPSGDGTVRGPLATLLMAELDSLVDELSYEELWEVFGGPPSERGLTPSQIQALPDFVVAPPAPSSSCSSSSDGGSNDSGGAVPRATRSRIGVAAGAVISNRAGTAGKACMRRQQPPLGHTTSECCAVCLEDLCPGERARLLPGCRHSFHAACIDPWLRSKPACPVCRAVVVATP